MADYHAGRGTTQKKGGMAKQQPVRQEQIKGGSVNFSERRTGLENGFEGWRGLADQDKGKRSAGKE